MLMCHVCWLPFSLRLTPKCLCAVGSAPRGRVRGIKARFTAAFHQPYRLLSPTREQAGDGVLLKPRTPSVQFSPHRDRTAEETRFSTHVSRHLFICVSVITFTVYNVNVFGNSCII